MNDSELKIILASLEFSTAVYEELGRTIKESASKHLVYLKEKALIGKIKKLL